MDWWITTRMIRLEHSLFQQSKVEANIIYIRQDWMTDVVQFNSRADIGSVPMVGFFLWLAVAKHKYRKNDQNGYVLFPYSTDIERGCTSI
ncbi:hypothetical protein [Paenibacillus xylanexedens]|uniref:hypothetical protein n=1 Tax=Paenibacillus xylanexedens TaxID=528191 RepID=UPI0011A31AB9|nr:hypothetical protein [Paenibacillus xylanexedens]